jgi:hypothetical protein
MLEAFSDLTNFADLEYSQPVYDKWHELAAEGVSGNLVDNIFGGGTIDTERLFMTGFLSLSEIHHDTASYVWYFKSQGYHTEGFHAGDEWYYDRESVCKFLGFDNYYFLRDFPDSDRTDIYFFPKIRELYDARDKSVPYFAHNLTYQNHGGYYTDARYGDEFVPYDALANSALAPSPRLTDETYNILNNYLVGINDTCERIYEFVDTFRDDAEPVILIFYGDHKPWLGNGDSVYAELGVNIDPDTEEGFYNRYTTPYIIWANNAARATFKLTSGNFTGNGGDFSSCFLMNKLFAMCGWGGNAYMKATNNLLKYTDIVSSATGYFRENGVLENRLSPEGKTAYFEARAAEYFLKSRSYLPEELAIQDAD